VSRRFNTVVTKLADGRPVVGGTVSTPDIDIYCGARGARGVAPFEGSGNR
jgi:hypothetical protein